LRPPGGPAELVRWSEYVPDGLLAECWRPADTGPEHREFQSLERIEAWERVTCLGASRSAARDRLIHAQRGSP